MLRAQASGTQVEACSFAVPYQCNRMNIGQPTPISVSLRVADIVTEQG